MKKVNQTEFNGYSLLAKYALRVHKLFTRLGRYFFKLSKNYHFAQFKMIFGEREDDIYISTYPKSGTTVMQMILYHLTTDGLINFNHIYDVSPWIRNASFRTQKPPNLPSPRIIKTHDHYKDFDKNTKGRFIYVYRNGMDVAVSHYHQEKNYNNPKLEFDQYINGFFKRKKWFKHTRDWMTNRKKLSILYVRYEDLLNNKAEEIERIINFLGITKDQKVVDRALKYSSFEYMKENEHLFGDHAKESKKVYDQFIRKGESGEGKTLFNKEQKTTFETHYNKMIKSVEEKTFN